MRLSEAVIETHVSRRERLQDPLSWLGGSMFTSHRQSGFTVDTDVYGVKVDVGRQIVYQGSWLCLAWIIGMCVQRRDSSIWMNGASTLISCAERRHLILFQGYHTK